MWKGIGRTAWVIAVVILTMSYMLVLSVGVWRGVLLPLTQQEVAPVSAEGPMDATAPITTTIGIMEVEVPPEPTREPVHWPTFISYRHGWEKPDTYDQFLEVLSSEGVPLFGLSYTYGYEATGVLGEVTLTIDTYGNDLRIVTEGVGEEKL